MIITSRLVSRNLWDRFQIIPRDNVDSSKNLRTFLKFFKVFFYLILFLLVLGSAVVNKLAILVMTSSIVRVCSHMVHIFGSQNTIYQNQY